MAPDKKRETIAFRIRPDLKAKLQEAADKMGISISALVENVLCCRFRINTKTKSNKPKYTMKRWIDFIDANLVAGGKFYIKVDALHSEYRIKPKSQMVVITDECPNREFFTKMSNMMNKRYDIPNFPDEKEFYQETIALLSEQEREIQERKGAIAVAWIEKQPGTLPAGTIVTTKYGKFMIESFEPDIPNGKVQSYWAKGDERWGKIIQPDDIISYVLPNKDNAHNSAHTTDQNAEQQ